MKNSPRRENWRNWWILAQFTVSFVFFICCRTLRVNFAEIVQRERCIQCHTDSLLCLWTLWKKTWMNNYVKARLNFAVDFVSLFSCTLPLKVGAGNLCRAFFLQGEPFDRTSRWSWGTGPCRSWGIGLSQWPEVHGSVTCIGSRSERLRGAKIGDLED